MSEENEVEGEEAETETVEGEEAETETVAKAPAGPAKLIRGRMPLPLVWNIRFKDSAAVEDLDDDGNVIMTHASDSTVAKKYFTTAGKVMDIRTDRNFKYLTKDSTFSQADIDEGKAQLTKNIAEGKVRGADEASHDFTETDAQPMFDMLDGLVNEKSTIADDRATYNEANPRATKPKTEEAASAGEPAEGTEADDTAESADDGLGEYEG